MVLVQRVLVLKLSFRRALLREEPPMLLPPSQRSRLDQPRLSVTSVWAMKPLNAFQVSPPVPRRLCLRLKSSRL